MDEGSLSTWTVDYRIINEEKITGDEEGDGKKFNYNL